MSIEGEMVWKNGRWRLYVPVVRNSKSTLFLSEATIRCLTGRPSSLA